MGTERRRNFLLDFALFFAGLWCLGIDVGSRDWFGAWLLFTALIHE